MINNIKEVIGLKKDKEKARYYLENCNMPFLILPDALYEDDDDE